MVCIHELLNVDRRYLPLNEDLTALKVLEWVSAVILTFSKLLYLPIISNAKRSQQALELEQILSLNVIYWRIN